MSEVVAEAKTPMNNVEELMKILLVANKLHEQQQISLLLNQISEMEKNHAAVMKELTEIKSQLNEVLGKKETDPAVSKNTEKLTQTLGEVEGTEKEWRQRLDSMKQDLNQKAQKVVQRFKDVGIKALNKVCDFLGIQEKLIKMRDHARSSEMKMKTAVEKIDAVEKELFGAMAQIKSAGRILADKQPPIPAESSQNISLIQKMTQKIKNHCLKRQKVYAKRAEKLDQAIEKFHALEQKASVLRKLSDNKDKVSLKEKDNEDKQQEMGAPEHKRDENTR